jgi:hypothetical protein
MSGEYKVYLYTILIKMNISYQLVFWMAGTILGINFVVEVFHHLIFLKDVSDWLRYTVV